MKSDHASSFLSFYAVFGTVFAADTTTTKTSQNSLFNAVTSFDELGALYLRMRIREPHLEADKTTDTETKRRICQSVATSGYFATTHMDSLDMDTIYLELLKSKDKEAKRKEDTPNMYYAALLRDYERKSWWRNVASYRFTTKLTTFHVYDGKVKEEEYAFACVVKHHYSGVLVVLYISDAYNINTNLNFPTDRRIGARFVCVASEDRCNLTAIAEEPAKAFRSLEYDAEDVYLRMRQSHSFAETAAEDSVCGLTRAEKLRVCASVMGSSNFMDVVKFRTIYGCEKKRVSLRTKNAKVEPAEVEVAEIEAAKVEAAEVQAAKVDDEYYEWMLICSVVPVKLAWSTYYVSRAYQSQYAIVYTEDYTNYYLTHKCEYYIESIHANVSAIIEDVADDQLASPNLIDNLLKDAYYFYDSDSD